MHMCESICWKRWRRKSTRLRQGWSPCRDSGAPTAVRFPVRFYPHGEFVLYICAVQQCGQLADGGAKRLALSGGIAYSNVRMQQDLRVESGHGDALRQHVRPAPRVHIHKALRLLMQTERFWCYWLCWVFGSRRWPGCLPSPETSGGCWPLSGISGGCCPSPDWPPG